MIGSSKITCVFVHGWAMNSSVWKHCLQYVPEWMDVVSIDLPGYGKNNELEATDIDGYVQSLVEVIHRPAIWVGWSLGGLVVLRLARLYPELAAGLFLVATNPSFTRKHGWKNAVEGDVFAQFTQALRQDVDATVNRFLALQAKGSASATQVVREIKQAYKDSKRPSTEVLNLGLDMLVTTDLRDELSLLECPITWLLGECDKLVPIALAEDLKALHPEIEVCVEKQAAHAPFISHPQEFVSRLVSLAEKLN